MPELHRPRLWLSEEAEASIRELSDAGHPDETGGILLGAYVGRRRPWVVQAVAVEPENAGPTRYKLPADTRPGVVDRARERDARLGYLGDWHSHPADVGPSASDAEAMRRLGQDEEAACPHPVLVIARRTAEGYRIDARQLARRKLRKLRVIAAGGLPQSECSAGEAH